MRAFSRSAVLTVAVLVISGATTIARAQSSPSYRLKQGGMSTGGEPTQGETGSSPSFKIRESTVGAVAGDPISSASYRLFPGLQRRAESSNPRPVIVSLRPAAIVSGSGAFTLEITGVGFVRGSVVRWNGVDRPTIFVASTVLQAAIPASDVNRPRVADVTVLTQAPGGGLSNSFAFAVEVATPAVPQGPPVARTDRLVSFQTGGSSCGEEATQYEFDWGDGTSSGWLPAASDPLIGTKAWAQPATYAVRARARCASSTGLMSAWSSPAMVEIREPETIASPVLTAPSGALRGDPLLFTASGAISSWGSLVDYEFDFGDGTSSGFLPSGVTTTEHAYARAALYVPRVRARSSTDSTVLSDWSAPVVVAIGLASGADLVVGIGSASRKCKIRKSALSCTISAVATVQNSGDTASSSTTAVFMLSTDEILSADDRQLDARAVAALKPGRRKSVKMKVQKPPAGETWEGRTLFLIVDPQNALEEKSESNNTAARRLP